MGMLVLSRAKDESIMIGQDIKITVVGIQGSSKVRLGIEAPREIPVHRQEIFDAIEKQKVEEVATAQPTSEETSSAL